LLSPSGNAFDVYLGHRPKIGRVPDHLLTPNDVLWERAFPKLVDKPRVFLAEIGKDEGAKLTTFKMGEEPADRSVLLFFEKKPESALQALFPSMRILGSGPLAVTGTAAEEEVDVIDMVTVALATSGFKAGDPKVVEHAAVSEHDVLSVGFSIPVYEWKRAVEGGKEGRISGRGGHPSCHVDVVLLDAALTPGGGAVTPEPKRRPRPKFGRIEDDVRFLSPRVNKTLVTEEVGAQNLLKFRTPTPRAWKGRFEFVNPVWSFYPAPTADQVMSGRGNRIEGVSPVREKTCRQVGPGRFQEAP
jgi:hypothetical protein